MIEDPKLREFIEAVFKGAAVYGHPDTAKQMELILTIEPNEHIEPGMLYAINMKPYDINTPMPLIWGDYKPPTSNSIDKPLVYTRYSASGVNKQS